MWKPKMDPYEFRCPHCYTGLKLPTRLEFGLPNGDPKSLVVRPAGSIMCPNCASFYKFKKIWDRGISVKLEVYHDGDLEPCFTKFYKKTKVK